MGVAALRAANPPLGQAVMWSAEEGADHLTFTEGNEMLRDYEYAHMAARCAWLCPEDEEQRENATIACAVVGVGWVETVARYMEATGADADHARRQTAEGLRKAADWVYEHQRACPS